MYTYTENIEKKTISMYVQSFVAAPTTFVSHMTTSCKSIETLK